MILYIAETCNSKLHTLEGTVWPDSGPVTD